MKKQLKPPRWATCFLHWFCAPHLLEEIEGDIQELYYERVSAMGSLKAHWLYWVDVVRIFRPFALKIFYSPQTLFAMESKKHPSVDLRRKYSLFLSIGLLISLAVVTTAFEWKTYDWYAVDLESVVIAENDIPEIIPPTRIPPPPPPPKEITLVEVSNEEEIEDVKIDIDLPEFDDPIEEIIEFDEPKDEEPEMIHFTVEEHPSFPGGTEAFYRYVSKNLNYPNLARSRGVKGKVFLSFVIDKDGSISDVEVVKGIGAGCDEEAVRVLKNAPKWNPGKQRGKPVKVRMVIPIMFALK